jgi:Flp pilus assembly pilin Flp
MTYLRRLVREESGQDLIEYAMVVELILLFCVGAVTAAGRKVRCVERDRACHSIVSDRTRMPDAEQRTDLSSPCRSGAAGRLARAIYHG